MLEPPIERILRRPNFSTRKKDTGVEHTFTSVVINTIRKGFLIVPSLVRKIAPK